MIIPIKGRGLLTRGLHYSRGSTLWPGIELRMVVLMPRTIVIVEI